MNNENKTLDQFDRLSLDWPWPLPAPLPASPASPTSSFMHRFETSGSGGFCEHIFKFAAKTLFEEHRSELEFKCLRNPDFREVTLERQGEVLLRFAIANGFRNIQNLVQKLKRGKSMYHFVEVMACPSGCLNGGAQIRPDSGTSTRDLCSALEELYKDLPQSTVEQNADDVAYYQRLYTAFFGGYQSDKATALLHTEYHAVEKINTALNIKW